MKSKYNSNVIHYTDFYNVGLLDEKLPTNEVMQLSYLQAPYIEWTERLPKTKEHPRHWITIIDIVFTLSDGRTIFINKGTVWDGSSIPKPLWRILSPFDKAVFGDFIHDMLWKFKYQEIVHFVKVNGEFNLNIHSVRKFADDERHKWRCHLAPELELKNELTHFVVRNVGGLYYSRQREIPI